MIGASGVARISSAYDTDHLGQDHVDVADLYYNMEQLIRGIVGATVVRP